MSETGRVLVVDDDVEICRLVARCLELGGFRVDAAHNGAEMDTLMTQRVFDLIILDLNLPGEDGLMFLRGLRETLNTPVVILTSRGEPVDRVVGLELGADDYVAKPFEPRELLARVRSVLRRVKPPPESAQLCSKSVLRFGGWVLKLQARSLTSPDGEPVDLTTAQYEILVALLSHPNRVLTRDQLLDLARDRASTPFDRSIDVHIGQLRKKIEADRKNPQMIKTVHGVGYMFTATVTAE